MTGLLASLAILVGGGLLALALSGRPRAALAAGSASAALGSALGLFAALSSLSAAPASARAAWRLPLGELHLRLDPLSAFFLTALFALALPAAVYGHGYMRPWLSRRRLGPFLFFFNLLLAAMAVVLVARDAVLFLVAWEVMALASFFLVAFEHEDAEVRGAGFSYLIASHLGTAFLLALFLLMARQAGSFDLDRFAVLRGSSPAAAGLLLSLALVGFGTKAGLVPLHVWLPEAHPAAPSHVSALMSGVLVKTGLYGLLRVLGFLPPQPLAAGLLLAAVGLGGALGAIVLALGQKDLKRALAYSSVENVGLIALGVGLGIAGAAAGSPAAAALGWAGALLHVWNHALMKGLAFMGAGALAHAAHTRDLERMGGLLRRLPAAGGLFLVGAAALAALPPWNGFASEWLLYRGLLEGVAGATGATALVASLALLLLALTGAVAAVAFTRLAGAALLGAPRSEGAARASGPDPAMLAGLFPLAAGCAALGLFPAEALGLAAPAVAQAAGLDPAELAARAAPAAAALAVPMRLTAAVLLALAAGLWLWARRLRARVPVTRAETWGCGFSRPSARMQYTAASFSQLALDSLAPGPLRPDGLAVPPRGVFPGGASLALTSRDPARTRLFDPAFAWVADRAMRLRRLQAGRLNLQLLYTVVTLLALAGALWLRGRMR